MDPTEQAELILTKMILRLEDAGQEESRSSDFGIGYRTGLRMAIEIAEGIRTQLRRGEL